MNQPIAIETYTFSRALHLMRYGGKKMRINGDDEYYFFVDKDRDDIVCGFISDPNDTWAMEIMNCFDIMGEWVEVK